MRIAVCDDISEERQKLSEALKSISPAFSISEFDNGDDLLKSHALLPYDIIFLDIIMPRKNGLDTAALLREKDKKTPLIFVSSSDEFGVLSYRVLAFDYLLKPIDTVLLRESVQRLSAKRPKKEYITLSYSGIDTEILLSNIQCLESNLRKVIITLVHNKTLEISGKLSDFEGFLSCRGFCRCHKSYIVNIGHIDSIEGDVFRLTGGKTVKISRTYLKSAKKAYFDYVFSSDAQ